jgi:hypothetical protein
VSIEAFVDNDGDADTLVVTLRTPSLSDGIEIRLEPSKLLYAVDRTAYVELLSSSLAIAQVAIPVDLPQPSALDPQPFEIVTPALVAPQIVTAYDGPLSELKASLSDYLESLGGLEGAAATNTTLRDSLLAAADQGMGLDWKERQALQAALKVTLRRTLVKFGVLTERAETTAEKLVAWFRVNVTTTTEAVPSV